LSLELDERELCKIVIYRQNENLFTSPVTHAQSSRVKQLYFFSIMAKTNIKETTADGPIYTDSTYCGSDEKRAHYVNHHMKGKQPSELADDRELAKSKDLGLTKSGWFAHRWKKSDGSYAYAILGPDDTVYTSKRKAQSAHKGGEEIYIQCQRKDENGNICGAIRTAFATSDVGCNKCGGAKRKVSGDKWIIVSKPSDTSDIQVSINLFK